MSKKDISNIYFAERSSEECVTALEAKANRWFESMTLSNYFQKISSSWYAYHGSYYYDIFNSSHQISFGGEQGELTNIAVNHYRNLGRNTLNIITAVRPSLRAQSVNTDSKSAAQTTLANHLLNYYIKDKSLETYTKSAVEQAIVLSGGYVMVEWNSNIGEVYDTDDETGEEIREGDLTFSNPDIFNVCYDVTARPNKRDWVIVREFENRFDIAAKYPEYEDQILSAKTISELNIIVGVGFNFDDQSDHIPVYKFYHKRTEACPEGRHMIYLDKDCVLFDGNMPYRELPVYEINPSRYLGTNFGYTDMFDLLPLQDAVNSIYSTLLTNLSAFGVQHLAIKNDANITLADLEGGLNLIRTNNPREDIVPISLVQQPQAGLEMLEKFETVMETISGINSVSRGDPDPQLRSGNALALVQSMTLQYLSGLQQAYVKLLENLGNAIIHNLQDHAVLPRLISIVGKNKGTMIEDFTGGNINQVNRVTCEISNPLAQTTAGRTEMASELLQMGIVKTAEQYYNVLEHGNLDYMTEDVTRQLNLIRSENERIVDDMPVRAIITDDHVMHIREHQNILSDPDLRFDEELTARTLAHIQEHIDLLKNADPLIMEIVGQPAVGQPQQPGGPEQVVGGDAAEQMLDPTVAQGPQQAAQPPTVDPGLLPNPEMQEDQQAVLAQMAGMRNG